jgi:hypothetical protein
VESPLIPTSGGENDSIFLVRVSVHEDGGLLSIRVTICIPEELKVYGGFLMAAVFPSSKIQLYNKVPLVFVEELIN